MANGSDTLGATSSSVLLGYAAVDLAKPTRIKSLELKLSGRYRASWAKGVGPSRQTYSVDREFYHQSVALSQQQVVSDAYGTDSCHSFANLESTERHALAVWVEYNWTISTISVKMDGEHERQAVGVNGKLPVPIVKAQLGDTLVLRLHNNLNEPTGLHSHGILNNGTNYYDGAGMITECGVAPRSELAYEIPIVQTGTYWLHGHHKSQYVNGLRGPLIITDPRGEPYSYDEDIILAFEDWFPSVSTMEMAGGPRAKKHSSAQHTSSEYVGKPAVHMNKGPRGAGVGANGMPMSNSTSNVPPSSARHPIAVLNGMDGAKAPTLNFMPGRTYRIRLLNIGSTAMFRFGIEGHDMYVIEADGISTVSRKVRSVVVGTAQRVSVLVTAKPSASMNYRYRFELFTDIFPQSHGYNPHPYCGLVVYSDDASFNTHNDVVWEEFDDLSLVPLDRQPLMHADVAHDVVITADRTGSDLVHTYINNISFALPPSPPIFSILSNRDLEMDSLLKEKEANPKVLNHMDVVELRVQNRDIVHHPMHLHGHFFQIVERGTIGVPQSAVRSTHAPMRRDTTIVPPNEYAILRFRADNPGVWLFHCHIDKHMSLGLSMMFVSAPDVMKQRMSIPDTMLRQCKLLGVPV
ncbi:hypothetical protein GQ54DRAFT_334452 [Martensiomyces pterosporus]|nr:hypothetical protein GQ54DRAFT_334452 [Martensiomyces pterosporus]